MNVEHDDKVNAFLKTQRLSAVATMMPDGVMPHTKVMHFSILEHPLRLLFCTDNRSIFMQNLACNPNMSVAVGWSEEQWITVQMRGEGAAIDDSALLAQVKQTYYAYCPAAQKFDNDPHMVFVIFTPSWVRFSDAANDPSLLGRLKNYPG